LKILLMARHFQSINLYTIEHRHEPGTIEKLLTGL
jgi:hypothetical protein